MMEQNRDAWNGAKPINLINYNTMENKIMDK